jgi:hypothetical protein
MTTYQIRSPLAMCACAISGALSILLLVEPSFNDGLTHRLIVPVAVSIGLVSMAIITGVLAHGHGLWTASGAALALVSVGLSGAIVWEQSGRRAQTRVTTQTVVVDATKERARLTQLRAEADQILTAHRAAQARECASGKGKRCDGMSYTVRTWEAALEGYDAKLRGVPAPTPDAKVETISTAAKLSGYDADKARAWVSLIDPLLVPLLLELAAILCGVVAFGPKASTDLAGSKRLTGSTVLAQPAPDFSEFSIENPQKTTLSAGVEAHANENVGSQKTERSVRYSVSLVEIADEVLVPIVTQRGGRIDSQAHLAKLAKVAPGTLSQMLSNSKRLERVWDSQSKTNIVRLRA